MSSPPIGRPSHTTLPLALHRQDGPTYCGAACIQMIRAAAGEPLSHLVQRDLAESALLPADLPGECHAAPGSPLVWHLCPAALARSLDTSTQVGYGVRSHYYRNTLLAEIEAACRVARVPTVLLVDIGNHWLVVHGVRRDPAGGWYLDVRDPWPPAAPVAAVSPLADRIHQSSDCATRPGSARSHLLFPAGIAWRLTRNEKGAAWQGRYVAIGPGGMESAESEVADDPDPADQPDATDAEVIAAAHASFVRAAELGWPPAIRRSVTTGSVVKVTAETWSEQQFCWKAETNHMVELKRADKPEWIAAIAFVASGGRFAGQTRELIAPARGKSWILSPSGQRKHAENVLASARRAPVRPVIPRAPVAPPALPTEAMNVPTPVPGAAAAPPLPGWLATTPLDHLEIGYFWRSCSDTRSPFHPLIQLSRDGQRAWITSDRRIVTGLGDDGAPAERRPR